MTLYKKKLSTMYQPDVLVCGLGPAGITAAVAAARMGMKTMAVDKCAFAGGNITNANVIGICSAVDHFTGAFIIGGIGLELMKKSGYLRDYEKNTNTALGKILDLDDSKRQHIYEPVDEKDFASSVNGVPLVFDAEVFKVAADEVLNQSGVLFLYHTVIADTITRNGHIEQVIIANKDGIGNIKPKIVIDCTGDADIAAWAGAPVELEKAVQPGTLMFTLGGMKYDNLQALNDRCHEVMTEANKRGEIGLFCGPAIGVLQPGVMNFNNTRIVYNATSAVQLSEAEVGARKDVFKFIELYKENIKEFQDAYILYSGPYLGARESRRIKGEYVLTLEDITGNRRFDDAIGLGGGVVDFHRPDQSGYHPLKVNKPHDIPFRTLLPQKIDNLLVAGRCHSASQQAAAVTRMAATAMIMGEAAGSAAAMSLVNSCTPNNVNINILRKHLRKNGVVLN